MTDKLELKSSHGVIYTVDVADVESIFYCKPTDPDILTVLMKDGKRLYCDEVCPLQEEPVSDRFAFKAIPRLLDMIEPTDKAKNYVTKLADAFDSEGYYTDAKIVRESLKIMNGEKVAMATMDEEPVSEDLEEAAKNHAVERYRATRDMVLAEKCKWSFKEGANWKREQIAKENMLLPFKEYDNLMESINKRKKEGYEAGYKQGLVDSKSE